MRTRHYNGKLILPWHIREAFRVEQLLERVSFPLKRIVLGRRRHSSGIAQQETCGVRHDTSV